MDRIPPVLYAVESLTYQEDDSGGMLYIRLKSGHVFNVQGISAPEVVAGLEVSDPDVDLITDPFTSRDMYRAHRKSVTLNLSLGGVLKSEEDGGKFSLSHEPLPEPPAQPLVVTRLPNVGHGPNAKKRRNRRRK